MESNAKKTSCNLEGAVKENSIGDKTFLGYLNENLKPLVEIYLSDYLSFNPLLKKENFYLKHYSIMQQRENFNVPFHYDSEYIYEENGEENVRNFAVLLYLSGDFEGGDLVFPVQKQSIKPEEGLLVIFPTSFMYPHTTLPSLGADRFVLRINYLLDKSGIQGSVRNSQIY